VFAVTAQVVPLPVTEVIDALLTPLTWVSTKSPASTPVTLSLKVTVHATDLPAAVGSKLARLIDTTVGGGGKVINVRFAPLLAPKLLTAFTLKL
jgi:hypothetical protein